VSFLRLLLDSNALLSALDEVRPLGPKARRHVEDPQNDVFVSVASFWELEIKRTAGKLPVRRDLVEAAGAAGFWPLPIVVDHALEAARLPLHHGDPFDRMLVAQARLEGMTLVSNDAKIAKYQVAVIPA
jgi:PIN domain nuclease of toxin-antitoxin system